MEQQSNAVEQEIHYAKEFNYNGFIRKCEITLYPANQWFLLLPSGQQMIGTSSILRIGRFVHYLVYTMGEDIANWVLEKFDRHFTDHKTTPSILVMDTLPGQIAVLPASHKDGWVLHAPGISDYMFGINNPYTFLDDEKIKKFEENYANECIKYMRQQFAQLYSTKIIQAENEE